MSTSSPRPAVALYSPAWPPGHHASGIVSYVGLIVEEFGRQGRSAAVIAADCDAACGSTPRVLDLARLKPSAWRICLEKLANKLPALSRLRIPLFAMRIADGVEELRKSRSCDLLEMEESFGTVRHVRRRSGCPVVVRLHGPWFLNGSALGVPEDSSFARRDAAERRAILEADGVTAPSSDVLEAVRRRYGVALPFAEVIPNSAPVVPEGARWTLSGSDGRTVLFVGRFDRHKGGDVVIDAFLRIIEECPDSRLMFVGPDHGLITASGARRGLRDYIEERFPPELRGRIEVTGPLDSAEIRPLRRSAAVTILASRYENFSLALLEALSFGCPTVATAVGGNPEILMDGMTGLLCAPDDSGDLAAKVVDLIRSPSRAAELGRAAALDMATRLSPDVVASRTWAYYERVLERTRRTGRRGPRRGLVSVTSLKDNPLEEA